MTVRPHAFLRAVPPTPLGPLSDEQAITAAQAAYVDARRAQLALVSDLHLTGRLFQPDHKVNRAVLKGMKRQAQQQADRASAVVVALQAAIAAIEATAAGR